MNFELNVELGDCTELQFGNCSIFDVVVELGDDMPFELPMQKYLEEMLIGIRGTPHKEAGEKTSATVRAYWQHLKGVLDTDAMRDGCRALFWIMMGAVMKRVSDEAVTELRESLAKSWARIVLDVKKVANDGPNGTESETEEWLLRSLPVILVQCLYRLLVDAFGEEKSQLVKFADNLLGKLTQVVSYEVSGFKLNTSTWQKERTRIFRSAVTTNPFVNQHDSLKSKHRREFLENRSKAPIALVFGRQDSLPLEEEQLEHIMMNRALARAKDTMAYSKVVDPVPSELSVDRYASISQIGDQLLKKHLEELNPGLSEMSQDTFAPGSAETEGECCPDEDFLQMTMAGASITGRSFGKGTNRNRKEAEQAEKRRREDMVQKLIVDDPLPSKLGERSFDIAWVSPIMDRLVPVQRHRQGLRKGAADSRKIKMEVPCIMHSQSEPLLKLPKIPGQQAASAYDLGDSAPLVCPMPENRVSKHRTDITIEPPASLKSTTVLSRLEEHLVQFNSKSFGAYVKQFDIASGHKKQRMDPTAMRRAENNYVSSLHALVGPARQPALKLFDSPERKAKRRAQKK